MAEGRSGLLQPSALRKELCVQSPRPGSRRSAEGVGHSATLGTSLSLSLCPHKLGLNEWPPPSKAPSEPPASLGVGVGVGSPAAAPRPRGSSRSSFSSSSPPAQREPPEPLPLFSLPPSLPLVTNSKSGFPYNTACANSVPPGGAWWLPCMSVGSGEHWPASGGSQQLRNRLAPVSICPPRGPRGRESCEKSQQ